MSETAPAQAADAFHRLTDSAEQPDLSTVIRVIAAIAAQPAADSTAGRPGPGDTALLDALVLLRWAQAELGALEPALIAAARSAGASWQALAPALGVASRQAAERRYLRLVPATAEQSGSTRDQRVHAERGRRAGVRAVARWANDNTADLRQLAGQITALTDLDTTANADIARLHQALADDDAADLPTLLADAHRHLHLHPDLAARIATVTAHTDQVRRDSDQRRTGN
jgi:hypothetical protein